MGLVMHAACVRALPARKSCLPSPGENLSSPQQHQIVDLFYIFCYIDLVLTVTSASQVIPPILPGSPPWSYRNTFSFRHDLKNPWVWNGSCCSHAIWKPSLHHATNVKSQPSQGAVLFIYSVVSKQVLCKCWVMHQYNHRQYWDKHWSYIRSCYFSEMLCWKGQLSMLQADAFLTSSIPGSLQFEHSSVHTETWTERHTLALSFHNVEQLVCVIISLGLEGLK